MTIAVSPAAGQVTWMQPLTETRSKSPLSDQTLSRQVVGTWADEVERHVVVDYEDECIGTEYTGYQVACVTQEE